MPGGKIDYWGIALVAIGVAGLLYGISSASVGLTSPQVYVPVIVGVIAFAAFAMLEKRSANPVFPIRLLAHPAFLGAVIMGVFWNFGAAAISQMLPNIWQSSASPSCHRRLPASRARSSPAPCSARASRAAPWPSPATGS